MKTANYRWNDKVENFNLKLNQLREELSKYKKKPTSTELANLRNDITIIKMKQDVKKRDFPIIKSDEVLKNIYKRTNGGCSLKDKNSNTKSTTQTARINHGNKNCANDKTKHNSFTNNKEINNRTNIFKKTNSKENILSNSNQLKIPSNKLQQKERISDSNLNNKCLTNRSKSDKCTSGKNNTKNILTDKSTKLETKTKVLHFPSSKQATYKVAKTKTLNNVINTNTNTGTTLEQSRFLIQNVNDKKIAEKNKKLNEKKWVLPAKHVKIDVADATVKRNVVDQKKRMKFLHFEGEDGSIQVYPVYADAEIGFHNITLVDDDNLSQVKRENQDDDDIKTTKRLAEWSSELVYRYLEETIEKSKIVFKNQSVDNRMAELLKRMEE